MVSTNFLPYLPGVLLGVSFFAFLLVTSYVSSPRSEGLVPFRTGAVVVSLLLASGMTALIWSLLWWSSRDVLETMQVEAVQLRAVETMTLPSLSWRFLIGALVGFAAATALVLQNTGRHKQPNKRNLNPS